MGPKRERWTEEHRKTVREWKAWMEARGLMGADAAALLSVSTGVVSSMLTEQYTGRVDRVCEEMRRVLRRERMRRAAPVEPDYATTSITQQVIETLGTAHTERRLVMVLGPTGVGKTMGCRRYCQAEPSTIYLACGPKATPKAIVQKLAEALHLSSVGNTYRVRESIAKALQGTGRLLIADEIDYVLEDALQTLRMIHDVGSIGMALVGTDAYLDRLRSRNSSTVRQLLGRVSHCRMVNHCSDDDIGQIAGTYGLDDGALEALCKGASGQARRAVLALCAAQRLRRNGIDGALIRKAYGTLMPVEV